MGVCTEVTVTEIGNNITVHTGTANVHGNYSYCSVIVIVSCFVVPVRDLAKRRKRTESVGSKRMQS